MARYAASRGIALPELLTADEAQHWKVCEENREYPFFLFACLLERCALAAQDDAFALGYVADLPARSSGVFHTIIANSTNLRDAFCGICRLCAVKTSALALTYQERHGSGFIEFVFESDLRDKGQFITGELAVIALRVREQLGDHLRPSFVQFSFPAPRSLAPYEDIFGHNLEFNSTHNRIAFPLSLLHEPLNGRFEQAVSDLKLPLSSGSRAAVPQRVAAFLRGAMQRGEASETHACSALNIGRRTLQRELMYAGTSFRKLLEDERRRTAEYYLSTTDLSLLAISALLGYSEQSAFSRACRAWFGKPPSAVRRAAAGAPRSQTISTPLDALS